MVALIYNTFMVYIPTHNRLFQVWSMVALIYNTFMVYIPTANEKEEGLLREPVMCTTTRSGMLLTHMLLSCDDFPVHFVQFVLCIVQERVVQPVLMVELHGVVPLLHPAAGLLHPRLLQVTRTPASMSYPGKLLNPRILQVTRTPASTSSPGNPDSCIRVFSR
jgi:hypothetical protein